VGHAASAFAPNYGTLLTLRLVMVAVAAIYTPQAASTIALIVPAKERPSAIAFVFLGWSLALAAGLPLITFLAAHLGWRAAYGVLAALAAASLLLLVLGVPNAWRGPPSRSEAGGESSATVRSSASAHTALTTSALFVIFTYLGPLLLKLLDAGPRTIGMFFALFGVAGFIGNCAGHPRGDAPRRLRHLGRRHPVDVFSAHWSGRWASACSRPWPSAFCCKDSGSRRRTRCSRHGWSPPRLSFPAPPSRSTPPRSMSAGARLRARRLSVRARACGRGGLCHCRVPWRGARRAGAHPPRDREFSGKA
jgi:hypothetical protein